MKLLKVPDIAEIFSQPETWVYRHWRDIGGFKLGGKVFFRLDKMEKIIIGLENDCQQIPNNIWNQVEIPIQGGGDKPSGTRVPDAAKSEKSRSQRQAYYKANRHALLT